MLDSNVWGVQKGVGRYLPDCWLNDVSFFLSWMLCFRKRIKWNCLSRKRVHKGSSWGLKCWFIFNRCWGFLTWPFLPLFLVSVMVISVRVRVIIDFVEKIQRFFWFTEWRLEEYVRFWRRYPENWFERVLLKQLLTCWSRLGRPANIHRRVGNGSV